MSHSDSDSTSKVKHNSDEPFLSVDVDLEVLPEPRQLSHGTTEHISTLSFRSCNITTKITDLRRCFFADGLTGLKREACVIFFELEFGKQDVGSSQRITEMVVRVLFEEVEATEGVSCSLLRFVGVDIVAVSGWVFGYGEERRGAD